MILREIRRARDADWPEIAEIFWRGVQEGAAPRYSEAQRRAWLPARPEPSAFAARLGEQAVWVAEEGRRVTGFLTLRADGYLDMAYVLPEMRGTGTAAALLAVLENHAAAQGLRRLTVRASDMARPFLARHGWTVIAPAPQTRDGIVIPATDMARALA
ncbi:GNAT family N-acetyltransferase [Jannaschia seohaensis]|uniref:Putative acetyltransferase n=1 Tax=Jannaschia seohaensis TaxID=475081 RepID=A0A2Y9AQV3_9RHOB|nr:GNAT family N-acetyltransferase [Jannaschia seohaensis]PWJ18305.1 putative acetyltransferase [Jannaschia seohaensis]SSA46830.1 putative acetyltransferase [Jannaschia seohaensis]